MHPTPRRAPLFVAAATVAAALLTALPGCSRVTTHQVLVQVAVASVDARPLTRAAPWTQPVPASCTARVLGGHNYFFCQGGRPFDEARALCRSLGADLAIIGSRYENDAVAAVVAELGRGRHLLGHDDRATEGRFETVDASPMTFSAWAAGEPNNVNDEDCVELDGSSVWNDMPCDAQVPNVLCEESAPCTTEFFGDRLYHLCEGPPGASPAAFCAALGADVAVVDGPAEQRFLAEHAAPLGGRPGAIVCETASPCVRRILDGRTFLLCLSSGATAVDARAACADLGGALAVVDDARTNAFLYASFNPMRRTHFYIDLRDDDTEGLFYTRNGPAGFTAWAPNEPNNAGDEDCVELADGGWNDVPCASAPRGAYVCELPGR